MDFSAGNFLNEYTVGITIGVASALSVAIFLKNYDSSGNKNKKSKILNKKRSIITKKKRKPIKEVPTSQLETSAIISKKKSATSLKTTNTEVKCKPSLSTTAAVNESVKVKEIKPENNAQDSGKSERKLNKNQHEKLKSQASHVELAEKNKTSSSLQLNVPTEFSSEKKLNEEEDSSKEGWTEVKKKSSRKSVEVVAFNPVLLVDVINEAKKRSLLTGSIPRVTVDRNNSTLIIQGDIDLVSRRVREIKDLQADLEARVAKIQTLEIPLGDKRKAVFGPNYENLNRIRLISGAQITFNKESCSLIVRGEEDKVSIAKQEVQLALNPPPAESVVCLPMDRHRTGILLAGQGALLKNIEIQTGAKLVVEGERADVMKKLVISGTYREVFQANEKIMRALKEFCCEEHLSVSLEQIRLLLYADALQFKKLCQQYRRSSIEINKNLGTIKIIGPLNEVTKVKDEINAILLSPPPQPALKAGEALEEVDLGDAVGAVVGSKYVHLKNIKELCSGMVEIEIPPTTRTARIRGERLAVERAKQGVLYLIERHKEKVQSALKSEKDTSYFAAHQDSVLKSVSVSAFRLGFTH
jgi:hypothetical protein